MLKKSFSLANLPKLFSPAVDAGGGDALSTTNYSLRYLEFLRRQNYGHFLSFLESRDFVDAAACNHIKATMPAYTIQRNANGRPWYCIMGNDVVVRGKIPDEFDSMHIVRILDVVEAFNEALAELPEAIELLFIEFGVQYCVAPRLEDYNPDFRKIRARGAGNRYVYESLGVHIPADMQIVVPAFVYDSEYGDERYAWYRDRGHKAYKHVVYHELGHALDEILNATNPMKWATKCRTEYQIDFLKARREDAARLSVKDKADLKAYLTVEGGGEQYDQYDASSEVFAELFAEKMMGAPYTEVTRKFPKAAAVFARLMQSINCQIEPLPKYTSSTRAFLGSVFHSPLNWNNHGIIHAPLSTNKAPQMTVKQLREHYFSDGPA